MKAPIGTVVYPSEAEADIVLRDGSTVHVRPVAPRGPRRDQGVPGGRLQDVDLVSLLRRWPTSTGLTDWSVDVDYGERFGLVAETGSPRRIIAHAAYVRSDPDRAEVAFLVADEWQGHGIATILLAHLAEAPSCTASPPSSPRCCRTTTG